MDNWNFNSATGGMSMPYNSSDQSSENKRGTAMPHWPSMGHSDMSLMGQELAMFSFGDTGANTYSNAKSQGENNLTWSTSYPSQSSSISHQQGKDFSLPPYGSFDNYGFNSSVNNDKPKTDSLSGQMPWSYGTPSAMSNPTMLPYPGRTSFNSYGNMGQNSQKNNSLYQQPSPWSMGYSSGETDQTMMSLLGRDNFPNCNTNSNSGMSFSNTGNTSKDTLSNQNSFWSMGYPVPPIQPPPMNSMSFMGNENRMSSTSSLSNQTTKENISDRQSAWPLGYPAFPQQQQQQQSSLGKVNSITSSNDFNHAIDALLGINASSSYKPDHGSSWPVKGLNSTPASTSGNAVPANVGKTSTQMSSLMNSQSVPATRPSSLNQMNCAPERCVNNEQRGSVDISKSSNFPVPENNTFDDKHEEKPQATELPGSKIEPSLMVKHDETSNMSVTEDFYTASDKSTVGTESGKTTPSSAESQMSSKENVTQSLKRSRKEHEMSSSGESCDEDGDDESSESSESSADEEDDDSSSVVNGCVKDEEIGENNTEAVVKTELLDDVDSTSSKSFIQGSSNTADSAAVDGLIGKSTLDAVDENKPTNEDIKQENGAVKTKKRKRKQDSEKAGKKSKTEKRKKREKKEGDDKTRKNQFERRNIRKIIKENDLEDDTKTAQQEEIERKKRLQEQQKKLLNNQCLKALLESSDEEDVKPKDLQLNQHHKMDTKPDVINISSDDEDVVPLSDVPEDDDEDDENYDAENRGLHVDDSQNLPQESGYVLVNVGHPDDEPNIFLPPQLSRAVKPHQIGGVRFLYDNLVESLARFKTSRGFGCILAHSMGLGKTIQVISFIDVFLRHTSAKSVLCIVPINTLQNWIHEFDVWLPSSAAVADCSPNVVLPRSFELYIINDNQKNMEARAVIVDKWQRNGGVLLMGYEMYRLLSTRKPQKPRKPKKNSGPIVIDLEEEDRNNELAFDMQVALLSPGPDLVICDEGHRIKNSGAGISKALKEIHTKRRVVLTGYPLQNNLLEYWCMVDFVRPNFLGTRLEFSNMFERPIMNAQCMNSTPQDMKLMRERAHVLHSLLEGFVQRRGHAVLKFSLPVKHECVIIVRMSDIQRTLYKEFMNILTMELESWASMNPLKAFSVCCKIWNHPDVIYKFINHRKGTDVENDLDIDPDNDSRKKTKKQTRNKKKTSNASDLNADGADSFMLPDESNSKRDTVITYEWAEQLLKDYVPGDLMNSGKFVVLFELMREILAVGDKLLVFSQSLMTLNLIEEYLGKTVVPVPGCVETWTRNKHYFRLDGSTSGVDREKLINMFNNPEKTDLHLFLLSTKAGCLGINLIGANRVVIMDASWNPCHDAQAVCRIYRYGQTKPCHIYRLVTDNTLENKIYQRQVSKQTVANRVVDEMNPNNNFSRRQVDSLLEYEDKDMPTIELSDLPEIEDDALSCVLKSTYGWLTRAPFNHESLLLDQKEYKLTKAEKRIARQRYEREKKRNLTYQRPSYAAYYPTATAHTATMRPNPLISNRRPFEAPLLHPTLPTPIPMQPHQNKIRPPFLGSQQQLQNSGVSVHQVVTTTDIVMPGTNTSTDSNPSSSSSRIPAGQQIMVIKTQKGVYIRTAEGRIFAVRSNKALLDQCQ